MIAPRALAAALACAAAACARTAAPRPTLDDSARQYVRLAVALGERDPDSIDFYAGPAELVEDVRRDPPALSAIARDASDLAARLAHGAPGDPDAARRRDLIRDLESLSARAGLLRGARLPYDRESRVFFGIEAAPFDEARQNNILGQIAALLPGPGALVDRYAAFTRQFVVPPDRLAAVVTEAVDGCRQRTRAHLTLPEGERTSIVLVTNRPWSAYSRYMGAGYSLISVNTDFRFTIDQALQVACHEGYPGHHVRSALLDALLVHGRGWPEFSVQATFSAPSLVAEATAMYAAGLAFPQPERIRFERERLLPAAGMPSARAGAIERHVQLERLVGQLQGVQEDVARQYLDGELEFARAATRLEQQALVPRAESILKYINEYRSYVTTYTSGSAAVAASMDACSGENAAESARWGCFERLLLTSGPVR
jgi:hypothetical protein